jgi:hypothetical protein
MNTDNIAVGENPRYNQEGTIQEHWQHWTHKSQNEDKQNRKNTTQHRKLKRWATQTPPKTQVLAKVKQFLPVIWHPPCFSYEQDYIEYIIYYVRER